MDCFDLFKSPAIIILIFFPRESIALDEAGFCGSKSTVAPKPLASPFPIGNPFFPKGVTVVLGNRINEKI